MPHRGGPVRNDNGTPALHFLLGGAAERVRESVRGARHRPPQAGGRLSGHSAGRPLGRGPERRQSRGLRPQRLTE